MPSASPSLAQRAFSLLELLLVLAIIGIVATFVVPAASTMVRGTSINQGSQMVTDRLSLARQSAITKNHPVEVRFLQYASSEAPGETVGNPSTGQYRGIQLMEVFESGAVVSLDKLQALPQGVIMNASGLSSLLPNGTSTHPPVVQTPTDSDPPLPGTTNSKTPIASQYKYVAFRFLPNGSTNLSPSDSWYVTLHSLKDSATASSTTPPPNFFTLQVDPVSGSMKGFRPSVQ